MRNLLLIVAAALLPPVGSAGSYSIRNPAVRNPVGNSTVPVSSFRSGLLTTPAPIDTAAELSITGNLRGGKHFRGNVPYRSTSDMGLDPATSSLNSFRTPPPLSSFLRDSAGPEDFGRRSSRYSTRPYYSVTDTVATTVPGQRRVFGSADTQVLGAQQSRLPITRLSALESLPPQQIAPGEGATMASSQLPPLRTRYDSPVTDSLSTSDGTFVGQTPPSLWDAGRLTPGEAAMRQQDLRVAAQRLREHNLRFLLEDRRESGFADGVTDIDGIEPRLAAGTPARTVADVRDRTAAHYRLSPLETSDPLVYPVLQPDTAGPKETARPQLPTAPPTPALGVRGSFVSRQSGEAIADPGPALLPPGDLSSQLAPGSSQAVPGAEQGDVMAQIRQRLNDLAESVESRLQNEPDAADQPTSLTPAPETYKLRSATKPYVGGFSGRLRPYEPTGLEPGAGKEMLTTAARGALSGKVDYRRKTSFESARRPSLDAYQKMTSLPLRSSTLSPAEMSGQARRIMGTHDSRQSFSDDKFNRHMRAAEDHLRAHRYYEAADCFALALVYEPGDPRALTGRCHALFAAGEYVSSALYLCRVLETRPDHAKSKMDLVTLLGDRSRLAGRIADLEQWSARSGSPQLGLLLSYVYLQTGRFSEAAKAIEAADVKTPNSGDFAAAKAAIAAAVR